MASRSTFGRQAIVGQRAKAEFGALVPAVRGRVPVPYPVQVLDTELLLEFIGAADETAAPHLAETRPVGRRVGRAVRPAGAGARRPGREGFAHGDLLAYRLMVHDGRLVMIAFPRVVDVIANPAARST
jgi:RIO kinase 1